MGGYNGSLPSGTLQTLFVLRNANMWTTADQQFQKLFNGTKFLVFRVYFVTVSGVFNSSAQGGIYTDVNKGGLVIVPATTNYGSMIAPTIYLSAVPAGAPIFTASNLYLSLSSANNGAFNCDIFVIGFCLD